MRVDENAPVEIPASAPLPTSPWCSRPGGQLTFDMGDLSEFGLGEGVLGTPEIPSARSSRSRRRWGPRAPSRCDKPTLTLSRWSGRSVAEVAKYRAEQASSDDTVDRGLVAAGVGGIVAASWAASSAAPWVAPWDPRGRSPGVRPPASGAPSRVGPRRVPRRTRLFDAFRGDFDLTAISTG